MVQKGKLQLGGSRRLVDWLLKENNPSVGHRTMIHLLGLGDDNPDVLGAKLSIHASRVVKRILSKQGPGGGWGSPTSVCQPKYKSTYRTLMALGLLGADRSDAGGSGKACESVFSFQHPEGGSCATGSPRRTITSSGPSTR